MVNCMDKGRLYLSGFFPLCCFHFSCIQVFSYALHLLARSQASLSNYLVSSCAWMSTIPFCVPLRWLYFLLSRFLLNFSPLLLLQVSKSSLTYVDIEYAGMGPQREVVSTIMTRKVPPHLRHVTVTNSAFNGINMTLPGTFVHLEHAVLKENAGGYCMRPRILEAKRSLKTQGNAGT